MPTWILGAAGLLAGAVLALWRHVQLEVARRDGDFQRAQAIDLKRQLVIEQTAMTHLRRLRSEDVARLEAVVAHLKREIQLLEKDVNACASPDAVRSRLNRLLQTSIAGPPEP